MHTVVKWYTQCSLKVKMGYCNGGCLRIGFWYFDENKIHLLRGKRLVVTAEVWD